MKFKEVKALSTLNLEPETVNGYDLLNLSVSLGIISEKLSDELYEYLTFRHFFVHAYGFMIEESPLEELANNIPKVWLQFFVAIENYLEDKH